MILIYAKMGISPGSKLSYAGNLYPFEHGLITHQFNVAIQSKMRYVGY